MKARNPETGNLEEVYVEALDSMPVGTQVEYTGSTIPVGWEEVNDYSATEVDTGKRWIDGKKIYRRTFTYYPTTSGEVNFTFDFTNLDTIMIDKSHTFLISSAGTIWQGFTYNTSSGGNYCFDCRGVNKSQTRIQFFVGSNIYSDSTIYATVEYTKSS